MAGIVISKTTAGLKDGNHALIGKLATPLKMYIMNESDAAAKEEGPAKWLCTHETSNRFAESSVGEARTAGLELVHEGDAAPSYGRSEVDESVVKMYQFMRKEIITAEEIEDSRGEVSASMKRQLKRMTRDYYVTRNNLAAFLMANGTKTSAYFGKELLPIGAPNGNPLFFKSHPVGTEGDTQSNIFYATRASGAKIERGIVETMMSYASVKMSNMKTNDGQALGYYPDTIVIPGNNPALLMAVKQAVGSELTDNGSGAASNGINIQAGNWNIIALPYWQAAEDACPMIFMSSAAREDLGGNMMYTRKALAIHDWIDGDTWNYCWTARARLGVGHHTYKHALYFESLANGTTTLADGQAAATAATQITL